MKLYFEKNQDHNIRYWCESRKEVERIARTIEREHQQNLAVLAKMRNTIQVRSNALSKKENTLAEKDIALAEKENALAEMRAQIAMLTTQLNQR